MKVYYKYKQQRIPLYYRNEGGSLLVTTNQDLATPGSLGEVCETQLHITSPNGKKAHICVSTAALLRAIALSQGVPPNIFEIGFIDDKKED